MSSVISPSPIDQSHCCILGENSDNESNSDETRRPFFLYDGYACTIYILYYTILIFVLYIYVYVLHEKKKKKLNTMETRMKLRSLSY